MGVWVYGFQRNTPTPSFLMTQGELIMLLAIIITQTLIIIVLTLMLNHASVKHHNTMSYVDTLRKEKRILLSYLNWADVPNN